MNLYWRWRMLENVPFRRTWFRGMDLEGNRYFERRNPLRPDRLRRMVRYKEEQESWLDYKVCPQWESWLRHTRTAAPALDELQADVQRRAFLERRLRAQQALVAPEERLNLESRRHPRETSPKEMSPRERGEKRR